jgi:DNA-binding transcriptional MerR regulator
MKKILFIGSVMMAATICTAYTALRQHTNDMFQLMGVSKVEAELLMKDNLIFSGLSTPSIVQLKKIDDNKRTALVNEIGNYMKRYFKSEEVATAYKEYRASIMPGNHEGMNVTERIAELKRDLENTEADKKAAPAEHKKMYEDAIAEIKKAIAILQNPKHPDYNTYVGFATLTKEQQQELDRQIAQFNTTYPDDIQQYIKLKLQAFLDMTDDIDFDATLIKRNGKLVFENPAYQAKDYNWKKCFRAGKTAITAARLFAQQWIKDIQ